MPFRPPSFRRLTIVTGGASALAAISFIAAMWLLRDAVQGAEANTVHSDEAHTAELAAETLLSTFKDAETGQRGYLLTDDPSYLEPYEAARARLPEAYDNMAAAPFGDAGRSRRIAELRTLGAAKLDELGQTIALWQAGRRQDALDIVRTNRGQQIMGSIRTDVAALRSDVETRMSEANVRAAAPVVWAEIAGLAAFGGILLGSVIVVQGRANSVVTAGFARLRASTLALDEARQRQQQANTLLSTILETAPGLIYAKNRDGTMLLANAAVLSLFGKPWAQVEGRTDRELLADPVQGDTIMANDRRIMDSGRTEEVEEIAGDPGRKNRIWLSTKTPLRDQAGQVTGLVGVSVEITERKRVENRLRLMVNELNHRVKNTLATVQSIASHTLRGADPLVRMKLEDRLLALSSAHDVLTHENWEGADLHDLVSTVLAPHGGAGSERFSVTGAPLRLVPRAAIAISLGLHELSVNALKYGALSTIDGMVSIAWAILPGDDPRIRLLWQETGGPTVVPPSGRGFGSRLIERSLATDLQGVATIRFEPSGVVCEIVAPLADVLAPAETEALLPVGTL